MSKEELAADFKKWQDAYKESLNKPENIAARLKVQNRTEYDYSKCKDYNMVHNLKK